MIAASEVRKRIMLVSMVKNESKVVSRMIASARPYADAVFLCDTGSSDDTVERARTASAAHPFSSASCEWKDFSFNRTEAIRLAKEEVDKYGWDRASTWLLLLDADQELKSLSNSYDPAPLTTHDIVQIKQVGGNEAWVTPRCIRASINCKYTRRTHEYLDHDPAEKHTCQGFELIEHSDGGCRAEKFIRDEQLLRLDLADIPDDPRTLFYLARTLRDLGRVSESRELYRRRVLVGDWDEECWMAQLQLGRCYIQEGALLCGRDELWRAFGMRPWRSEPLFDLAKSYVDTDRMMACRIAAQGKAIPYPANDILFIERSVYRYEFTRILAICSYYIGEFDAGLKFSNELRVCQNCEYHNEAIEHLCWYVPKLPVEWIRSTSVADDEGWHPCNPSIIKTATGYLMSVRTVNYKINANGGYYDYGSAVQTRTHLIELDATLNEVSRVELKSIKMNERASIKYAEDVRLCNEEDGIVFGFGTRVDGRIHTPRPYLLKWDKKTGQCVSNIEFEYNRDACEKNWLPWQAGDKTLVLYSHSPHTIFSTSRDAILDIQKCTKLNLDASGFSGSAAPVAWNGGWLYVVHECTRHVINRKRTYLHRFCWMDAQLNLRSVSLPFCFEEKGIEFCSGMALYEDGVVLTYGINDCQARMCKVSRSTINLAVRV